MKNFKGFGDWVEIFKGGQQIDSTGIKHDGDALIDKAVQTFNSANHEPPIVAGHPKDNAPAYGWVSELKKTGNSLFAKFSQVVPEFSKAVENGLFKKRSASFYPDGRLRHVGFLGAMPPAVKGLKDLLFSDDDQEITFEFKETINNKINKKSKKKEEHMKFSDFIEAFKFWKKIENDPDAALPDFSGAGSGRGVKTFSEADLEQAKKDAAAAEREKADSEFAEKQHQSTRKTMQKDITDFCGQLSSSGKIPPSWIEKGLAEFMQGLDAGKEISFSEGSDKKTGLQWFKDFLEGFSKSKLFEELAKKEKSGDSAEFAEAKADQAAGESIAAKVEPNKTK